MLCATNPGPSSFQPLTFRIGSHQNGITYDGILSADKESVVVVASNGVVYAIDLKAPQFYIDRCPIVLTPGDGFIRAAYSPVGDEIAVGTENGGVVFVNVLSRLGQSSHSILSHAHPGAVPCCSYSHDGKFLATGGAEGVVKVWDLSYPEPRLINQSHALFLNILEYHRSAEVNAIHYLPDGSIAAAYTNGYLIQWTLVTVRGEQKLRGRTIGGRGGKWICDSAIALEKEIAVIACSDHTLTVLPFNGNGFDIIKVLAGHTEQVTGCVFSDDQQRLLSYSRDGTLRIWSTRSWETLYILRGHTAPISSALFLPNGNILSIATNGELFIWQSPSAPTVSSNRLLRRSSWNGIVQPVTTFS